MTTPKETHHLYGPSKLGSIIEGRCQGKIQQEAQAPEIESGAGDYGRAVHHEIAKILQSYKTTGILSPTAPDIKDSEMRFLVGRCLAWLMAKGNGNPPPSDSISVEQQLEVMGSNGEVLTYGTADVVIVSPSAVVVVDWKSHHELIDDEDALWQVSAYLVGAMQKYGRDHGTGFLYLPRLDLEYVFTVTLADTLPKIEAIIHAAQQPDAPLVAGTWCKYCAASSFCPAIQTKADVLLAAIDTTDAEKLPKTKLREKFKGQLDAFAANGNIQKIAELAELSYVLEPALGAVRDMIRELIEAGRGELFPDWEITERRVRRKANILEVYRIVNAVLSHEEFAECADIKWGQLEKLYTNRLELEARDRGDKVTKKACKEMLETILEPVTQFGTVRMLRRAKGGSDD